MDTSWTLFGTEIEPGPIVLTLQVASITTVILLLIGTPLAWGIARMRSRARVLLEALVALPLVLPPTVLGFYLLILLGPQGPLAPLLQALGYSGQLTFTLGALVIGSVLYSLPFAVQPLISAFDALPPRLLDAAATLRAGPLDRFFSIALPLTQRDLFVAATLAFAHTVGEFGVVLMLGGNIPGATRMVSIAIYDHVEVLEYRQAHLLSALMLGFTLLVLTAVFALRRRLTVKVA